MPGTPKTIEAELATVSGETRAALDTLRQTIRAIVPPLSTAVVRQLIETRFAQGLARG